MTWMTTLYEIYVSAILAGKNTMEVRTKIPRGLGRGDTLLIVQAGTNGQVRVKCKVGAVIRLSPVLLFSVYEGAIQLKPLDYFYYFGMEKTVCGIKLTEVEELPEDTCREDFGLTRSPQWFTKVTCDKKGLL